MKQLDATETPRPQRDGPSAVDVDAVVDRHIAIPEGTDLQVQRTRPIVADLLGEGRIGVGTLLAPADPIIILDGLGYRLDAEMSASPVSPLARLRSATVVESGHGSRFPIDARVRLIDIARLPAHLFGATPPIVAVQLSGSFSGVHAPTAIFGRTEGIAVGFLTHPRAQTGLASELPHDGPNARRAGPRHLDRERRTHNLGAPGRLPGADRRGSNDILTYRDSGADARGGAVSVAPASRPARNRSGKQPRRLGISVERPPRSPSRGCPPQPTPTAARAAADEQAWARAMHRLRQITVLLGTALAAVLARILIDGPQLASALTGALILLLLACSIALRRRGRRLDPGASSQIGRDDAR